MRWSPLQECVFRWLRLEENLLLLAPDSPDMQVVQLLIDRGATVTYEPQKPQPPTPAVFRVEDGWVFADGTFYASGFATCSGCADVAEVVSVSGWAEPGDVLEHDPDARLTYRTSQHPCSSLVAGVVSTTPGIALGVSRHDIGVALMALVGIVPVKVTNEGGPIQAGDLLVTSSTRAHAMRWASDEPSPCSLVGKALEPMNEERGVILVLLTAH